MKRNIAIGFLIWLGFVIVISVVAIYYFEYSFDMALVQVIILDALTCLNVLYLFFLLLEFDSVVAGAFGLLFGTLGLLYSNLALPIDGRLQALYLLLFLIAITVIVRIALRKSLPR